MTRTNTFNLWLSCGLNFSDLQLYDWACILISISPWNINDDVKKTMMGKIRNLLCDPSDIIAGASFRI